MTIEQMAEQLGVSKSTVSRALSGKGRIGKETRERVLALAGSEERKNKKMLEKNRQYSSCYANRCLSHRGRVFS